MRVAVLGAGHMGSAIAQLAAHQGHDVVLGVRHVDAVRQQVRTPVEVTGMEQAATGAQLVVLAVPFGAVRDAVAAAGGLKDQVVVDLTNPLTADFMGLTVGFTDSAGERVAAAAPAARVVKAFNTVFPPFFEPAVDRRTTAPTVLVAADDDDAKALVIEFARSLGFEAIDAGPLSNARYIEPLAELGIQLAYGLGHGNQIGFRLSA